MALGVVSLLTDLSSEMIYPLLPLFLTSVLAAGAVSIGIIEGVAESTAGPRGYPEGGSRDIPFRSILISLNLGGEM